MVVAVYQGVSQVKANLEKGGVDLMAAVQVIGIEGGVLFAPVVDDGLQVLVRLFTVAGVVAYAKVLVASHNVDVEPFGKGQRS